MVFKKGAAAAIPLMGALLIGTGAAASAEETVETETYYVETESVYTEPAYSEETESEYDEGTLPPDDYEDDTSNMEELSEGDSFCAGIDSKSGGLDGSTFVGSSWDLPDSFGSIAA